MVSASIEIAFQWRRQTINKRKLFQVVVSAMKKRKQDNVIMSGGVGEVNSTR